MTKLLIVEDDRIIASIYTRRFQEEGFQVVRSADGQDALDKLTEFKPDVVVLDIMLPHVNGLEILRQIRSDQTLEKVPVIVFSNAYQTRIIDEAWSLGASDVLMKASTNPSKLVANVKEHLSRITAWSSPETDGAIADPSPVVQPASSSETTEQTPRQEFLDSLEAFIEGFKSVHAELLSTTDAGQRQACFLELGRACNGLAGTAGAVGSGMIARLAEVYQALFQELHGNPASVTASTIRTSCQTLGVLERLVANAGQLPSLDGFQPRVMLVEDEEISRRAALHALERAGLRSESEDDGHGALAAAKVEHFDLFVLDIDMIGMSGVELTQHLREQAGYANTPIVLVTGLHDYQSRIETLDGATDLIAKPYCFVELSLKALCYLFRAEMAKAGLR